MPKEIIGNQEILIDRPLNIIALDDAKDQVELIEAQLTREYGKFYQSVDHATTVAGIYEIARKYRKEGKPCDALLLDFNVPKIIGGEMSYDENGFVVAQNFRLDPHFKDTPIIVVTAYTPNSFPELEELLKMENVYYLQKNGEAEKLHKTIIKAWANNQKAA